MCVIRDYIDSMISIIYVIEIVWTSLKWENHSMCIYELNLYTPKLDNEFIAYSAPKQYLNLCLFLKGQQNVK